MTSSASLSQTVSGPAPTSEFAAELDPPAVLCAELAALAPSNPFLTRSYLTAMRAVGLQPWILGLRENGRLVAACAAFLQSGLLARWLHIPSFPAGTPNEVFWNGLLGWCQQAQVLSLTLNSLASARSEWPPLAGVVTRTTRWEYVLELDRDDPWHGLWESHRQRILEAKQAGLEIRHVKDDDRACREHEGLVRALSKVPAVAPGVSPETTRSRAVRAFTKNNAGGLVQAVGQSRVLASVLVLRAADGAYLHSLGATTEGMAQGAAHFLLRQVAETLRNAGIRKFNLGEADESRAWLETLKAGFSSTKVELESIQVCWGSGVRRKLGSAIQHLRENPVGLLRYITGQVERYVAYTADPGRIAPPEPLADVVLEKVSNDALARLAASYSGSRIHWERARRLGFNDAYAVYIKGQLAHISWLVTADHDRRCPVRNVKLRPGEAEIGPCTTLPQYRGRSLYPYAIRCLCQIAAGQGIRRIWMITSSTNTASQRGIEKGGLVRRGSILRVVFPYLAGEPAVTFRGHRWGWRHFRSEPPPL